MGRRAMVVGDNFRSQCSLLLVAPDYGQSELDASVDKVFDEGDSGTQDAVSLQPQRQRKRKTIVSDAGGPSHPPKRLREDHRTLSGASVGGKSRSAVQRLLARAVQNIEVRGEPILTLPFITSSVSATLKREDEGHTDSVTGLNLRTIGAPQRFVISSVSSHHSSVNILEAEVDSFARPSVSVITAATIVTSTADPAIVVKEKVVRPSIFSADSTSAGGTDPAMVALQILLAVISLLVFAPLKFFASVRGMEHDQLFTEFNVGAARQMSLSAKVRMCAKYNIKERRRLKSVVEERDILLKARDEEIGSLKAQLLPKEAEAAEPIRLRVAGSKFEAVEKSLQGEVEVLKERNTTLEKEKNELDAKVVDLAASVKVHELKASFAILQEKVSVYENFSEQLEKFQDEQMKVEGFYPHLLTTIAGCRWLLTYGMKLAVTKCLNSLEYLSALGAAISKAIEKGMQDGLAARITLAKKGRVLADVAAYNPSTEVDYVSALRQLQSVNFSLLVELKLNKDSSVKTLINILCLEETLAKRMGLNESQPHVDQLMVPIHHSPDQTVVGATALSLSLDVSDARVQKIRENIANHRSALRDVFIPLAEPFSAVALEDDYEVAGTDDQATANENVADENLFGGDVNPFPNVDNAELNVPE
ncbi:hypothetical protein Tco_1013465 [Tanacetum coccineum]